LKLQPSVLELAAGLGKLLSRLRQFFGQLGRHFGDLICHMIPKFSELKQKFRLDDVQFVVAVMVYGLLRASDFLALPVGGCACGPNCSVFVVSQRSRTAVFFLPIHIIVLLYRLHCPRRFHPLALGAAMYRSRIATLVDACVDPSLIDTIVVGF
jgi:hypothetical protein